MSNLYSADGVIWATVIQLIYEFRISLAGWQALYTEECVDKLMSWRRWNVLPILRCNCCVIRMNEGEIFTALIYVSSFN